MGWGVILKLLIKSLSILAWPSFTLICPLYGSIRAMKSDSHSKNQQCLSFWVLFSLFMIVESALGKLLYWLPLWPYAKGVKTVLLVLPYFGGASYTYKHFIKPYVSDNIFIRMWNMVPIQRNTCFVFTELHRFLDVSNREIANIEIEEMEKFSIYQLRSYAGYDSTESSYIGPTKAKEVQKEWSCALCQISTTSERCLEIHLQGKKHKSREKELKVELLVTKSTYQLSSTAKRTDGMDFLKNLNQIADLLNPVSKSIRWCRWIKPDFGWIKLNTDGSINRENAGFGGLLRNPRGYPICAFASKAPLGDIFLVELWAIWRGLVLALGLGVKVIWVESDSMSAVKTINKEQSCCPKADTCLKSIWALLEQFEKFQVSHSWRETNRAADHLAKMFTLRNDVVLWPTQFPSSLWKIIRDDAKGKEYRRGRHLIG
ncbi:HVA22-like protein [Quillaja saponaria]|uniref:HVA22-like protein n=1 Tax=Quillaja saponaria TaxID=32244 RepID=A0AAD7LX76_QUISA|nr:HVA22-like protein [Quillaja saponaria]